MGRLTYSLGSGGSGELKFSVLQKENPSRKMAISRAQLEEEYMLRNIHQYAVVNNELAERCFSSCVGVVTSGQLTEREMECVESCAAKLIQASTRVVFKVAELNPMGIGQQQQQPPSVMQQFNAPTAPQR